jgi:hypothetical protein
VLLFGLVAGSQIRLRRLDGWRQIPGSARATPGRRMTHRALAATIALDGPTHISVPSNS